MHNNNRIIFNHRAIMQNAWREYRAEEARRSETLAMGGVCYGRRYTIGDFIKRAWAYAKQEAHHYRRGGTASDGGLVLIVAAPVEYRQAA